MKLEVYFSYDAVTKERITKVYDGDNILETSYEKTDSLIVDKYTIDAIVLRYSDCQIRFYNGVLIHVHYPSKL